MSRLSLNKKFIKSTQPFESEEVTILVVDDNPANLEVLYNALSNVGYEVRVEVDGRNAITQIELQPPSLILLDVMLPGINGFEICQQLKANSLTQDIPIIFMTALVDTDDKVKGLSLGAVDYITKPFQQEEVLARVRLHLERRHLSRTLEMRNLQLEKLAEDLEKRTQQLEREIEERQKTEMALQNLVAGTASVTGEDFFPAFVKYLAATLGVSYAIISELKGDRLQTLAFWAKDQLRANFSYDSQFTPCQIVLEQGSYFCDHQVQEQFPHNQDLKSMEVNSYFGVLLKDSHHKPIGTLCLLDHQTMIKSLWLEKIVQIFASRAAAELERLQATKALENINQELEIRVKERTADLLQNQEYLRQITENIESVFWMTNLDKNQMIYVSPAYEKIWGNNKEELYSSPQKWLQAIHPDDRQQVLAALPQQIKGKYNQEYRIIRPDGELRWIRDSAFPIRNQSGQIYRIAGIAEDITRQKQIEETLKLQERAIAASNNGIVIVDAREPNSPTVFVNPAFERITGYPRQEVIGQNCRFLQGQDVNQPGLKKLRTALKTGQSCTVNLRNYRKDGSLFWNELSISPIYDKQGRLSHYIGIQTDISERIQAEKSLKDSLREKEILLKEIHHRVKNNLLVVSSLLDWQTEYIEDPAIIKILEESQQRIHSMALIHEKLYQSKNLAKINFSEYLKTLVEKLSYSFNLEEGKIELDIKLDPVFLNIETATPCGLIVSELIANTFEHAFPENRKGKVCLSLEQHQHQIILTVADNGVGLPSNLDVEQTETLGLQLINLLAQQLRGKVTFVPKNGNNGTVCELIFSELEYRRRI